jgi:hypothetical protein
MVLLIIPAIAIVVISSFGEGAGVFHLSGPLSDLLERQLFDYPIWRRTIGMILILVNAFVLNKLYNLHDFAMSENHYPSLIYLTLSCMDFDAVDLHPALLASFFVLLSLRRLLTIYRANAVLSLTFDSALLFAVAILFFPPCFLLLPLIWIALIQERTFNLKEWITPLSAIVFTVFYVAAYYYTQDYRIEASEYFSIESNNLQPVFDNTNGKGLGIFIFSALLSIFGLFGFLGDISKSTLRKKSTKYILLWLSFLTVVLFIYTLFLPSDDLEGYRLLILPAAIFMGVFFSGKGRNRLRVGLFYAWLLVSILFMVFAN